MGDHKAGLHVNGVQVALPSGRVILERLSWTVPRSRLVAIMGPSGSGKTTLLNCMANRQTLKFGGSIEYDGSQWCKALKRRVGVVEQDDIVHPSLTVRQTLQFVARLRLPRSMSRADKMARVEDTITLLKLDKCADTKVGTMGDRGISGGERKRLCIACELVLRPQYLLLDEPTSGLDSSTALLVVQSLRQLTRDHGLTVVTTIHQPSSMIFSLFDELLLLDQGKVRYDGPRPEVHASFADRGFPCPLGFNIADYLMDLVVEDKLGDLKIVVPHRAHAASGGESVAGKKRIVEQKEEEPPQSDETGPTAAGDIELRIVPRDQIGSEEASITDDTTSAEHTSRPGTEMPYQDDGPSQSVMRSIHDGPRYAAPYSEQLRVLMHRTFLISRVGLFTKMNLGLFIGLSLQAGALWFQLGLTEGAIFTRMSLCFWFCGTWTFFPMFGALPVFTMGRDALKKETSENFYRLSAYFLARTSVAIPFEFVWPLLYVPIVFGMSSLGDFVTFLLVFAVLALNIVMMQSVGLAISAGIPAGQAFTVSILLITFFFGYGGLFMPLEALWPWLQWIKWLNLLTYSFHLIMRVVFRGNTKYVCDPMASSYVVCTQSNASIAGLNQTLPNGTATGSIRYISSADVLHEYGIDRSAELCVAVMVGSIFFFRLLAYRCLRHDIFKSPSTGRCGTRSCCLARRADGESFREEKDTGKDEETH